jgi:phosphatidylglycerophosphate synthase
MTNEGCRFDRVVILADESANWKIAGLKQLERLGFALDEFSGATEDKIEVVIFWKPEIPFWQRWLPDCSRVPHVQLTESLVSVEPGTRILSTRVLVERNGMADFFRTMSAAIVEQSIADSSQIWLQLLEQFERLSQSVVHVDEERRWRVLEGPRDFATNERRLLQHLGKSQDGIVAKYLNRPISQSITRLLLRSSIEPGTWTISILVLPLIAFYFLVRGDYNGFVIGTAVFHIYNILDGCDGEIARAKYLESEKGRRLDASCDLIANLIFVLCLGVGLSRQSGIVPGVRVIYFLEGVVAFLLTGIRLARYLVELFSRDTTCIVSRKHEQIVTDSSERLFGRKLTSILFQLTKRDTAFLGFLLLSIAGLAPLVLHFFFVYSVITLLLAKRDSAARLPRRG